MALSVLNISFDSDDSFDQCENVDAKTPNYPLNISFSSDDSIEFVETTRKRDEEHVKTQSRGDLMYIKWAFLHFYYIRTHCV